MTRPIETAEIRPGLWRWTAPHPEWGPEKRRPGGWGEMVGCLYYEPPGGDATVLIDPLAPSAGTPDADRFWSALDRDVARAGRLVAILLGNHFHQRSAQEVADRYRDGPGAAIWGHAETLHRVTCKIDRPFRPGDPLPGGVAALGIEGLEEPEVALFLPAHRALAIADAVLGAGGGRVRVAPRSWAPAGDPGAERYDTLFRPSLRRLLDLAPELLLVSHGEPALRDGSRALAEALDAPAWDGTPD